MLFNDRSSQRVYFADTPWWVPLTVVTCVLALILGVFGYRYWQEASTLDQAHQRMQAGVQAWRDGGGEVAFDRIVGDAHVTVEGERVLYGLWGDVMASTCWVVHVEDENIAGPLPGEDRYCAPER